MGYIVFDLEMSFRPLEDNMLRLYEERRHDAFGLLHDGCEPVMILGGGHSSDEKPTVFESEAEALRAITRTNNWFFRDCGRRMMFRCEVFPLIFNLDGRSEK